MRPSMIDIDVADESLTGLSSNMTGATWSVTTSTPTDGLAHQLSIRNDSVTNHSAKTATIVGTDANGKALTETLALPNTSATVETTGYFKTVTSITPSATIGADTMDLGWVDEVSSPIFPLDSKSPYAANLSVDVTGTINFTVQQTFTDILNGDAPVWVDITALTSKTADTTSTATIGATAVRIITNSYSSGAELQLYITQASNWN